MSKRKTDEELSLITEIAKIRKELIAKGIDFDSDCGKLTLSQILNLYKEICMKESHEKIDAISREYDYEEAKTDAMLERLVVKKDVRKDSPKIMKIVKKDVKKEPVVNNKPKVRKPLRRKIKEQAIDITIGLSLAVAAFGAAYHGSKLLKNIGDERKLNKITSSISKEIETAVDNATSKINDQIVNVDYDLIANHIQNSENPDLELFVLYRDFDRKDLDDTKEYDNIADKVCRKLVLENKYVDDYSASFIQYVSGDYIGNQTKSELLDRYYNDCKYELLQGDDLVLQQLSLKVKKLTLSSADAKETY